MPAARRTVRTRIGHWVMTLAIGLAIVPALGCNLLTAANYNAAIQGAATQAGTDIATNAWNILGIKELAAGVPIAGPAVSTAARTTLASAIGQGIRNWFLNVIPSVDTQKN